MRRSLLDACRHILPIVNPDLIASALPAATLLAGIFLSLAMEVTIRPSCPGILRPWSSAAIHAGLVAVAWAALLLVVHRPVFATVLVLVGPFVVIQISNAKYRALREPFLFCDFGIFSQTIKHPRLYLPFLGIGRAALIAFAVIATLGFGWWMEKPLSTFSLWSVGAVIVGASLLAIGWASAPTPSLDPEKDVASRGLIVSIAQYWLREKTCKPPRQTHLPAIRKPASNLPDIVVIQSESFFDARRLFPGIRQDLLPNFDKACAEATIHGRLAVPAWGANTMRSEFAFLSGLAPASLGIHQFNPYRRITRQALHALPAVLHEAGYQTTCIHPHPARFFRRDRAFPNLGFNRFIDIHNFHGAGKFGPYISDEAVTDQLLHELKADGKPSFYFVITMENHGPLHLERVSAAETDTYYTTAPPDGCEDLTVYLRHLRNADQQLGRLRAFLHTRTRPTLLCFYGEHLPSMPKVYDALGQPDGRTDYLILSPRASGSAILDLNVEKIAVAILEELVLI
jgi:hypothetical protein